MREKAEKKKEKTCSEHCADIEGVIDTREEIGIVSNLHWQMCFRLMLW
jgi:hypothetical protein